MRLSRLQILAVLVVGGVLGYLFAQGGGPLFKQVSASPQPAAVAREGAPHQNDRERKAIRITPACCSSGALRGTLLAAAKEQQVVPQRPSKPNILVIMGDDIGWYNPSCYHRGDMGYETPNIDRIAREGACSPAGTANRAAPPAAPRLSPANHQSAPG